MEGSPPKTFGKYTVYEQIGAGGMATVHRAERVGKDGVVREVALKRLLPAIAMHRELRRAFVDEGKLTRFLHHPNIAETYESGMYRETAFIAMEYLPGPTLKQLVQQCGMTVGAVPTPIVLNIAAQLCEALDYAHNATSDQGEALGIIHRDVSPSNVILWDQGLAKLIDFGLAKARINTTSETGVGLIKGKYNYVAPEYLDGNLDARVDLWAVGVVLYELLTSRRLFDGFDDVETITRVRKLPIPRPSLANPKVTPALDTLVMTALERRPAMRWQTAAALRDGLYAVMQEPGNRVENKHVIEWTRWVFTLQRGAEASGMATLLALTKPSAPALVPPPMRDDDEPTEVDFATPQRWRLALGVVVAVLLVVIIARFVF